MDLHQIIDSRRSVRSFQAKAIARKTLRIVLSAANHAPSAGNLQAYRIYLVRSDRSKRALAEAALGQDFLTQAPVILVFVTDSERNGRYGERGRELYALQDATIAAAYAQLAATAVGLATCWIGAFEEHEVVRALGLPAEQRPVALLPIGYPGESPLAPPRRDLDELVTDLGK